MHKAKQCSCNERARIQAGLRLKSLRNFGGPIVKMTEINTAQLGVNGFKWDINHLGWLCIPWRGVSDGGLVRYCSKFKSVGGFQRGKRPFGGQPIVHTLTSSAVKGGEDLKTVQSLCSPGRTNLITLWNGSRFLLSESRDILFLMVAK